MYKEGNIIYYTPFYFEDGGSKPKYFIVLKVSDDNVVLATLPTRRDDIPEKDVIAAGCIEMPEINLNCFVFGEGVEITECGKCFKEKTHIYGYRLNTYAIPLLEDVYQINEVDYTVFGKLKETHFNALISCMQNSRAVKMKYKRLLAA